MWMIFLESHLGHLYVAGISIIKHFPPLLLFLFPLNYTTLAILEPRLIG